jgi:hypothetical protein
VDGGGQAYVVDMSGAAPGEPVAILDGSENVRSVAWAPDSAQVAVRTDTNLYAALPGVTGSAKLIEASGTESAMFIDATTLGYLVAGTPKMAKVVGGQPESPATVTLANGVTTGSDF